MYMVVYGCNLINVLTNNLLTMEDKEMREIVKFKGIDCFNRPVFKSTTTRNHFGSTDILFGYDASEEEVLTVITESDLVYFGSKFDCEPMGTSAGNIEIERQKDNEQNNQHT